MTQRERRIFLIRYLLDETDVYHGMPIPRSETEQWIMLRGLLNIRPANPVNEEFLTVQNEYLQNEIALKGITDIANLTPVTKDNLYLWQGDITMLRVDAIVNAANSGMTGCWKPNDPSIDNCIHTFAGVQLRLECDEIMRRQGHEEPTGQAKITKAYNLPSKYVIHTVGPIVGSAVTRQHREQLASSYRSCLDIAYANNVKSVAFCCISTGTFRFPQEPAAKIAVDTVRMWLAEHKCDIKVVFNVFTDTDLNIYNSILEVEYAA